MVVTLPRLHSYAGSFLFAETAACELFHLMEESDRVHGKILEESSG